MRSCPNCSIPLTRATYEGITVDVCSECRGHLVEGVRLKGIQRKISTSHDQLLDQAKRYLGSSVHAIVCPACSSMMKKESTSSLIEFELDVCPSCHIVWLDGGELALLQIAYETTHQSKSAEEFKRRVRELELDPARKARFEHNLAQLPEGRDDLVEVFGETVGEGLARNRGGIPLLLWRLLMEQ
jgi:Zn-finger nucleic acid-binding protein